ncbi:host specificity protein [Burkholderia vietnamiensis]|uniref:host specificity protein J n=1 Tax=Burkholderia vietnamiensis TaxID=60552 RepID=UPI000757ACEE|nr:host specificity protein J [Burkholderia vietnamiensis]KVE27722.1 host specificity protein [Burkholderia vietnamiensis]
MRIQGSKGGGSSSTPTQSPDSLHSIAYAKVLDVLSEGPIGGLVSGLQSVYLNGTPIQNSDGSTNFANYSFDARTGTQDQTYLAGFPAVENEIAISTPLTSDAPWVRQVQNTQLTAVRLRFGVPALQVSDATTGNVTGYRVEYAIDLAVDGGSYSQVVSGAFDGKTTSLYERSVRIELPAATSSWLVRVRRITPNAHSSLIADTINIEAITEVIDRKLRYPMSALIGLTFDAQSFSSVPTRSYDIYGLLIRVPTNYNPVTRAYTGAWDGTFKTAWSNNPAWVFYDLVLNARYGLGNHVDASMVDKWGLYQIAQYCDVMVADGKGGQEPRFTCNCVIQSQADAYKVLQDLATTFRGIAYWGPGSVVANADMPADPVYVYTAANVVGGQFKYVGSALKTRYTTALVSWNDPANQYKQAVEYVRDEDGIARYGVTKAQITAFGTTSQGQAHRLGLWTLLTSRYETNTVSFSVGLDGTLCAPGQIIAVADPAKAGKRMGGRIRAVNGAVITLDKAPSVSAGDVLTAILPTGVAQKRTVRSSAGDAITVDSAFDTDPVVGAVWMLENTTLNAQLFRVISVQEASDNDQITYTINAAQHEPGKYAAIDNGAAIQVRPITVIPPSAQVPPANVRLSTYSVIDQGISKTVMVIAWDAAANGVSYLPEWRKDNGEWVSANQTGGLQVEVSGIYHGTYSARVRAVNGMGVTSVPAYSADTTLTGKTGLPPAVASLSTSTQVFAIEVDWTFPADGTAGDTQRTEIWYSRTNDLSTATKLSDYAFPQARASLMGLAAGQSFFFWARLVDTSGNIGPWYPSGAGVNGQSSSDATPILAYLTGAITKTQLGSDVLTPVNAIPGLQQSVSDNAAAITTEQQSRATADAALSTRIDQVSAQVVIPPMAGDSGGYAGSTTVYAGVWSEQSARAEADMAQAQKFETVTAQVQSTAASLSAAVQTEAAARIAADTATASQITTVQAQVDSNTAAVQTNAASYADINGRVAASYQIKTQITAGGRTYIAGIGVGVDNASGTVESQVLVAAQRFAILDNSGSTVSSPFVVQGGQVFLSQAFIGTGWITNAMIGQTIQSTAVGANGQPLWILDKANGITFNGPNGGSGYLNINSSTLTVYDSNGTLRVRLGIW